MRITLLLAIGVFCAAGVLASDPPGRYGVDAPELARDHDRTVDYTTGARAIFVKGEVSRAAYLNVPTTESSAGVWPAATPPLPYDAYSPGGSDVTVWKGFQRNHAAGLELLQAQARSAQ
jgi:hypothetical protein